MRKRFGRHCAIAATIALGLIGITTSGASATQAGICTTMSPVAAPAWGYGGGRYMAQTDDLGWNFPSQCFQNSSGVTIKAQSRSGATWFSLGTAHTWGILDYSGFKFKLQVASGTNYRLAWQGNNSAGGQTGGTIGQIWFTN